MDVKVIRSGRNKIQLLVEGFRYYRTKGPMGVDETCYFLCIVEGCKARAATSGPISTEEVNVKYHNRPTPTTIHQTLQTMSMPKFFTNFGLLGEMNHINLQSLSMKS